MTRERVFGLDLMRAVAILLVVFWHSADVLGQLYPRLWLPPYMEGVDLFFVLSGYLIGGILLRHGAEVGSSSWTWLVDFWQRRWLRTLPNYYLFLLVNVLLAITGITGGLINHNLWVYVVFLQNVWHPMDLFFWESWSLVVEEWYYILFPLCWLTATRLFRPRASSSFLFVCALFIILPAVLRASMAADTHSLFEFEQGARKMLFTRLDTIGFGMLAAWLHHRYPARWTAVRWPLFVIGLLGMGFNSTLYDNDRMLYASSWFYSVNALVMASMLPFLASWKAVPRGGGWIVRISIISYSLYLVHQPVRACWNRLLWDHVISLDLIGYVLYWLACIALAWLVHRYWEKRFMDLRDRIGARLKTRVSSS